MSIAKLVFTVLLLSTLLAYTNIEISKDDVKATSLEENQRDWLIQSTADSYRVNAEDAYVGDVPKTDSARCGLGENVREVLIGSVCEHYGYRKRVDHAFDMSAQDGKRCDLKRDVLEFVRKTAEAASELFGTAYRKIVEFVMRMYDAVYRWKPEYGSWKGRSTNDTVVENQMHDYFSSTSTDDATANEIPYAEELQSKHMVLTFAGKTYFSWEKFKCNFMVKKALNHWLTALTFDV